MTTVLALGSNLGDRFAQLQAAVRRLQPSAVSPVYETEPVGLIDQPDFLNAVLLFEGPAADAWALAQQAEVAAGRIREVRWGPRTLDVDVIIADEPIPGLVLPHPRAAERSFVLAPWLDLQPDAQLPGHGAVVDLLAQLDQTGLHRRDDLSLS